MKNLKVEVEIKGENYIILDVFSKAPNKKREIINQELQVLRNNDGTILEEN
jgi:hypothetical protein